MKYILWISTLLVALFWAQTSFGQTKWIAPTDQRNIYNPLANNKRVLSDAQHLYNTMCVSCHGEQGRGDGNNGLALTPRPADYTAKAVKKETDGSLYWKLTNGRGEMKSYRNKLSDEQRWALVSYIRTF